MALLIVMFVSGIYEVKTREQIMYHLPLYCLGLPMATVIVWGFSYLFVFTPADGYKIVKWFLQDFWQSGKEIWRE